MLALTILLVAAAPSPAAPESFAVLPGTHGAGAVDVLHTLDLLAARH